MATKTEITKAVSAVAVAVGREVDVPLLQVYTIGLSDLPAADLERATAAAIRQCKFMPSPAELRELAGVHVPRLDGGKSAALAAWSQLQHARSVHYLASAVEFEDLAITATVRSLGGWERLLGLPDEQFEVWLKKEFLELYPVMAALPHLERRPLAGALKGIGNSGAVFFNRNGIVTETVKALPAPARSPDVAGLLDVGRIDP